MSTNNDSGDSTGWIIAKIASVWAAVGITSWAEAASALAFLYTLCLLGEFWLKRFIRPLLERYGLIGKDASP
jgi:hypothetical protein